MKVRIGTNALKHGHPSIGANNNFCPLFEGGRASNEVQHNRSSGPELLFGNPTHQRPPN